MEQLKCCRKCGIEKPLTEFHKDKHKKFGVRGICKPCAGIVGHEYYLKNEDAIKKRVSISRKSYIPKHTREIDSRLKNLCTKAKNRDKEFSLVNADLLDVFEVQQGLCAYTKLPLVATANQFNTISLDRIDSSKGYHKDNIQLVCAAINKMKQEYTEQMFISLCHLVAQNNKLSDLPENILTRD
jgi:hypothetical protein